jgi:hypothetical protein
MVLACLLIWKPAGSEAPKQDAIPRYPLAREAPAYGANRDRPKQTEEACSRFASRRSPVRSRLAPSCGMCRLAGSFPAAPLLVDAWG